MPRSICHSALLAIAALIGTAAAAGPPPPGALQPRGIGRVAQHPGPLVLSEEGIGEVSKSYGTPVWAASVTAPDGSFAPLNVVLVEGGTFLTPAVTKRFEEAIAAPKRYAADIRQEIVGRRRRASDAEDRSQAERELKELDRLRAIGPLLRPVRLPHGRRGYTTVLGFGRTDATFATILPAPDGRYDLVVSVSTPFEPGGLTKTLAAARYQFLLQGQPLDTVERMALAAHRQLFPPQRMPKETRKVPAPPAGVPTP